MRAGEAHRTLARSVNPALRLVRALVWVNREASGRSNRRARLASRLHVTPNLTLNESCSYQISVAHGDYLGTDPRRPCLAASRTGRTCSSALRLRGDHPSFSRMTSAQLAAPCGHFEGVFARALEEAGENSSPTGVRRRRPARPGTRTLYEDLRAISLRSACFRLHGCELLTDANLRATKNACRCDRYRQLGADCDPAP